MMLQGVAKMRTYGLPCIILVLQTNPSLQNLAIVLEPLEMSVQVSVSSPSSVVSVTSLSKYESQYAPQIHHLLFVLKKKRMTRPCLLALSVM